MSITYTPEIIMQKVATGKKFTLLHLLSGKSLPEDKQLVNTMQMLHLAHLFQLEEEGKSCIFGPVLDDAYLQGFIIFNTVNRAEIHELMKDDPYIRGGYLEYKLYDWFTLPGQTVPF